eukprot:SM000139S00142  [mRNA]  locus=s139:291238:291760:- [translate_table: standard]
MPAKPLPFHVQPWTAGRILGQSQGSLVFIWLPAMKGQDSVRATSFTFFKSPAVNFISHYAASRSCGLALSTAELVECMLMNRPSHLDPGYFLPGGRLA